MNIGENIIGCICSKELCGLCETSLIKFFHSSLNKFLGLLLSFWTTHVGDISTSVNCTSTVGTSCLLCSLLLLLSLSVGLNLRETVCKFSLNIGLIGDLTLHPWVTNNISERKSVSWDKLEHVSDEILELLGVEASSLVSGVSLPEKICSVHSKKLKVLVLRRSTLERRMTGVHDKENNGSSEKIYHVSLIWLSLVNFWSHIALSSKFGLKHAATVTALNRSCKTEVSDLYIEITIE